MFFGQQPDQEQPEKTKEEGPSLYEVIGLPTTATTNQITKHFRRRAVKEHPDKGGDPQKYRQLSEAYQILKDPEKRDLYDKYGMEGIKAGGDPNGGDFFSNFFGGGQQDKGPRKCKPKLVKVDITLEEAYHGGSKELQVTRMRTCQKCDGKGGENSKQCPGCKGARMKQKLIMLGPGMYTQTSAPCDDCHGKGVIFDQKDRCPNCKGQRIIENVKKFQVTIEPGVPHQNDIIFTGQADQYAGALAGDIYFRINILPHSEFRRKGADLYLTKKISLLESLTGVTFEVKLFDDETIICSSAPGQIISNHEKKLVKHKGMPFYKQSMSKGHLVITFDIQYPQPGQINDKDYAKLSAILGQNLPTKPSVEGERHVMQHHEDAKAHHEQQGEQEQDGGQGGVQCQSQ